MPRPELAFSLAELAFSLAELAFSLAELAFSLAQAFTPVGPKAVMTTSFPSRPVHGAVAGAGKDRR